MATLLTAGADGPLIDPAAPEMPLRAVTTPPGGTLARDLPMGALIGRRGPAPRHHGHAAPDRASGRAVRGGQRGGADRGRRDRQDRGGRAGDVPAGAMRAG